MTTELYFIRGINRYDTPYFVDKNSQREYMVSKRVSILEDTNYPPHYEDNLKFNIADFGYNDNINYLSIYFRGKYYYYFIDSIRYISEELLEVSITLDVVQTYMFDIDFVNSKVSRRLIDRWNTDGTINRDYIRENTLDGEFNKYDTQYYGIRDIDDVINKQALNYYVVHTTKVKQGELYDFENLLLSSEFYGEYLSNLSCSCIKYYDLFNKKWIKRTDGSYIMLIPDISLFNKVKIIGTHNEYPDVDTTNKYNRYDVEYTYEQLLAFLRKISEENSIINIDYITNVKISNVKLSIEEPSTLVINANVPYQYKTSEGYKDGYLNLFTSGKTSVYEHEPTPAIGCGTKVPLEVSYTIEEESIGYGSVKNTNKNTSFNSDYIPYLIDSNFINISFGEQQSSTTFPLEQLNKNKYYMYYVVDLFSNTRIYSIYDNEYGQDWYHTTTYARSIEQIATFNDAWKTYLSQNSATYAMGLAQVGFNGLTNTIASYESNKLIAQESRRQAYHKGGKNYKRKAWNNYYNASMGMIGSLASGGTGLMANLAINALDRAVDFANIKNTPDTQRTGNSCSSDIISNSLIQYRQIVFRNDIEDIARLIEGYGYSVHEYYANENLFNLLNTRYYFNVITCEDLEINLNNVPNDETTIIAIKNRFMQGLRLWNVDNIELGRIYVYDNVEKRYLTNE